MTSSTDDLRIESLRPLLPPAILLEELPLSEQGHQVVHHAREQIKEILHGNDDRLFVVVGPCSVHDTRAAQDYAKKLKAVTQQYSSSLLIAMRTYFEKPRTIAGWKGLINDPYLDGSFQINRGLRIARELLLAITDLGLPVATEFLDPITPQYVADVVSWGAIGARTTESQVHRELASGLSMPVGFKNGTHGSIQIALDAVRAAQHCHHFLGTTKQGINAIVATRGNPDCHIILRGGSDGPNYHAEAVDSATQILESIKLPPRLMVDCSHANSSKDHTKQPMVADNLAQQIAQGSTGIFGIMLESFLVAGKQDLANPEQLTYGQSVTDACMDWEMTCSVLDTVAHAVEQRRARLVALNACFDQHLETKFPLKIIGSEQFETGFIKGSDGHMPETLFVQKG
jgi:3-deoxy-7-phosphoheptulonate synthase